MRSFLLFSLLLLAVGSDGAHADSSLPAMAPSAWLPGCMARLERARVELGRRDRDFARGKMVQGQTAEGNFAFELDAPREDPAVRPPLFSIQLSRQQDAFYDEADVDHVEARLWPIVDRTDGKHGRPTRTAGRHVYQHPRAMGWTIYLVEYFADEPARFERFRDVFARASEDCVLLARGGRQRR